VNGPTAHTHADTESLTVGCSGCVERVRLGEDYNAALRGEVPPRRPKFEHQMVACVHAWFAGNPDEMCAQTASAALGWIAAWSDGDLAAFRQRAADLDGRAAAGA
jgi:hypothetical protein